MEYCLKQKKETEPGMEEGIELNEMEQRTEQGMERNGLVVEKSFTFTTFSCSAQNFP